jgi:hypothetical protein
MENDPEKAIEHDAAELEERVERLGDHVDDARDQLRDRAREAGGTSDEGVGEVAGDWEDTDDQAGGEDPVGAGEPGDRAGEDA